MFENGRNAKQAGKEAAAKVVKAGGTKAQADRAARQVATRTEKQLDDWTRKNVGLD